MRGEEDCYKIKVTVHHTTYEPRIVTTRNTVRISYTVPTELRSTQPPESQVHKTNRQPNRNSTLDAARRRFAFSFRRDLCIFCDPSVTTQGAAARGVEVIIPFDYFTMHSVQHQLRTNWPIEHRFAICERVASNSLRSLFRCIRIDL